MKEYFSLLALLLFACGGNNNSPGTATSTTATNAGSNDSRYPATPTGQKNGIVDEWQLKYIVIDQN